jgi:uncharacterized membrane protein
METRALIIIPILQWFTTILEVVGVMIIVGAAIAATASLVRQARAHEWNALFRQYRADVGRGILLGLEFLVAADIIGTVAVTPSFQSLGVLGSIIFIRTFLSISLEVEIEGHWPWRRWEAESRDPGRQRL